MTIALVDPIVDQKRFARSDVLQSQDRICSKQLTTILAENSLAVWALAPVLTVIVLNRGDAT
jgi:hypothetical protein